MNPPDFSTMIARWDEAHALLASIEDPIEQRILKAAMGQFAMTFIRWEGITEEQFEAGLPTAPFDVVFYLQSLRRLFANKARIARLLAGDLDALREMPD